MKRPFDTKLHIFVKVIMTAIFLWSGFFWSGISIYNFYVLNPEYSHLSPQFLAGSLLLLSALILCFARLYLLQFVPCVIGFIIYLRPVNEMIEHVSGSGVYFKPTFEQRYLPMVGFAVLSLILFIARLLRIVASRSAQKEEFNNSPSESILEKRHDE